ncbi:MAG: DUF2157 domain-containing protein [Hyphomicrobiaceae bacterium]
MQTWQLLAPPTGFEPNMFHSRNQQLRDIERWQSAGWIEPASADAIRADLAARRSGLDLATVLGTLAAILIGFAVISFVAANWQTLSKLNRLAIIAAGLWSFLGLGIWLRRKGYPGIADAALLGAVATYGGGIMLIAQMYHMDGHPPDAVLLWAAGAVLAGMLTLSNPVLAAALVLFCVWSIMETAVFSSRPHVHWSFLPAWAVVASGFAITRWKPGLHLLAIALSGWIVLLGYLIDRSPEMYRGHAIVTLIGVTLAGLSIAAGPVIDRWRQVSGAMLMYGFSITFAGALALQFIADRHGEHTLWLGTLTLAAIVGALGWAWRTDNRPVLWLAYSAFGIEIFSLYLKKIGTLLGTSAFFGVTGLMLAALAWVAVRLHKAKSDTEDAAT